jgi:hypothetical protein
MQNGRFVTPIHAILSELGRRQSRAHPRRKLIGPCHEGDATGRGQPIKPPFDPLEPTIDIAPKILESADAKRERGASPPNEGEIKDLISLVNINYLNDLVVAGGVSLCLVGFLSPSGSSDLSVHP